jgi:hypothetical protein
VRKLSIAALTVLVLAAAVFTITRLNGLGSGELREFPPSPQDFADSAPSLAAFAGASSCSSCHPAQFATWRSSTHGRAGGTASTANLVAPFDGASIRFSDAVVTAERSSGGLAFVVRVQGQAPERFEVAGVVGGAHMVGGGTQGFVSRFPDGTLRFLPFDFAKREGVWFCNTMTRGGKGWVPITPELPIAACGDWPPSRILGEEPRIANCSNCHGSRIEVRFDTAANRYSTTVASLAIDCESCHGPGARHVTLMKGGQASADIGMSALATLSKEKSVETCMSCHAVKNVLRQGWRPGASLAQFYSVALAQFGDSPLHPDGRVRTFAYQEGHLSSDCYLNGGMTCTDCHDPHSQGYRDVQGNPLPTRFDDRQCTSCHVSKSVDPTTHTKHASGSAGSSCVSCHMPYLQHPEIGNRIRFARSDHTIPVPRPAVDAAQGITPSCVACHGDRSIAVLEADVRRLWGSIKPRPTVVEAASASSGRIGDDVSKLLPVGPAPLAGRMAGIDAFIERHLQLDMPRLDRTAERRLLELAADADVDIAAVALAALHYARGNDSRIRDRLVSRLATTGSRDAALRRRWTVVLGFLADRERGKGNAEAAVRIYRKALELEPAHPHLLLNLGLALMDAGDVGGAIEAYRRSIDVDPAQPLVFVNLGVAL